MNQRGTRGTTSQPTFVGAAPTGGGFSGIEIALSYAVSIGARGAMPEVILRVVAGTPCDEAATTPAWRGRVTPGRKPDERAIAFTPLLPTVRMTAESAVALATQVSEHASPAVARSAERSGRAPPVKEKNSPPAFVR